MWLHREGTIVLFHREIVEDVLAKFLPFADIEKWEFASRVIALVELFIDLPKRISDVGDDIYIDNIIEIDFGWPKIDMDNFLVFALIPKRRGELDKIVANRNNNVGGFRRHINMILTLQSHRKETMRVGPRHRTLTHEGIHHTDTGLLGQSAELLSSTFPDCAVTSNDQRVLRCNDNIDCLSNRLMVRCRTPGLNNWHRRTLNIVLSDVFGQFDDRSTRLFGFSDLERFTDYFRYIALVVYRVRPLGDWPEHSNRIHVLVALFVKPSSRGLADQADGRRPIHISIGDPGYQVGRAWAKRAKAKSGLAGQTAIDISSERSSLFMPT